MRFIKSAVLEFPAAVVTAAFVCLLALDAYFWLPHPFAIILGAGLGRATDPLIALPMIIVACAFGPDWRGAMAIALLAILTLFLAGQAVQLNEADPLRVAGALGVFVVGCLLNTVIGGSIRLIGRLRKADTAN